MSRERILEWLQSIPSAADPRHLPEYDRGLIFDPDASQATTSTTSQQQQQQQQQDFKQTQHNEEPQPNTAQRLYHYMPSPGMHRQTGIPTSVILTSSSHQRTPHAPSSSSLQTDASIAAQFHDHLSFHRRQKSESPLPDVPSDPELPTFTPKKPALPGNRAPKQPPRSDASGPLPRSALKSGTSVPGSRKVLLPSHRSSPSSLHQMRKFVSVTESSLSKPTSGEPHLGHESREKVLTDVISLSCSPDSTEPSEGNDVGTNQHRLESESLSSTCDKLFTHTPSESVAPPTDDMLLHILDSYKDPCAPLSSTELATLSLKVLDTLPQLAVYLGIDYSEYESITADEPSPQRQSMAVLMHWYRRNTSPSREELAHALQQSGEGKIAQQLLTGKLVESRHTSHDLEEEVSPRKFVASPTPVSLTHRHSSPSPLPPPSSQLSPEHKHPAAPLPSASSVPLLSLTARTSKLKQGFIFDEDCISSDSLPKFLSNRPLHTDSLHHQVISRDWRKSSLPVQSDKLLQVVEREDSYRDRAELERLTVGDEGRRVGFRKSELADSRRASGPALFRPLQTTETQLPPKRTVQLHSNLPSLIPPYPTAARSSPYPTSTFMPHEFSVGRERQDITKTNTSSVGQETQPSHRPQVKGGGGQPMKRQDSGIETLASSSVTHL